MYFTTFSENLASCCELAVALVLILHSYQQKKRNKITSQNVKLFL